MRNLLLAMAMLMATSAPAMASESSDVIAAARGWTDAFSRRSFDTAIAPCSEDAVVIDDLPPHVWQGPGSCTKWFKTFDAWAAKSGVTDAVITLGEIRHLETDGHVAYLVAPVMLSYVKADKPVGFHGMLTMALRKQGSGWQISGVAWADQ